MSRQSTVATSPHEEEAREMLEAGWSPARVHLYLSDRLRVNARRATALALAPIAESTRERSKPCLVRPLARPNRGAVTEENKNGAETAPFSHAKLAIFLDESQLQPVAAPRDLGPERLRPQPAKLTLII